MFNEWYKPDAWARVSSRRQPGDCAGSSPVRSLHTSVLLEITLNQPLIFQLQGAGVGNHADCKVELSFLWQFRLPRLFLQYSSYNNRWQRSESVLCMRWLKGLGCVCQGRGIKKRGGRVMLNAHVDEVIIEGGRARGVSLQGGSRVLASKAVVSNASLWDTQRLLPASAVTPKMIQDAAVCPHPF